MNSLDNAMRELTSVLERCTNSQFDHSQDDTLGTRIRLALQLFNPLDLHRCNGEVKDRIYDVITCVSHIINFKLHLSKEKADHIRDQLLNVGDKLQEKPYRSPKSGTLQPKIVDTQKVLFEAMNPTTIHQSKIDCKIAYFCDIDYADWNGAILGGVSDILQNPMPFITSLSILNGSLITTGKTDAIEKVRNLLNNQKHEWDLFLQVGVNEGEHVVFIPKQGVTDKTDEEKLAFLDLICDGSLQKISVDKAFSAYNGRPRFESFTKLFREEPNFSKLFYLDGHGGVSSPGGMQRALFVKFLRFLERQHCKGMAITSCFAGGESTLNFLSNGQELKKGISFPVMVQSMGDLATFGDQEAEFSMKDRLEMMQGLIEAQGGLTYKKWKEALMKCEDGKTKCFQNQVQVYFPHSAVSPSGFRPLEEMPGAYSLTMAKLGRAIHEPDYDHVHGLKISPINYFTVLPLVVNIPITFTGNMPLLVSQFPGPSHHYFSQIFINETANELILVWMKEMQVIYDDVRVRKAFFIGRLSSSIEDLDHLVVYIGTTCIECCYKWRGIYFHFDGKLQKHISPLQYGLKVEWIIAMTVPSASAEIAGTAGQQNSEAFLERIALSGFIPEITKLLAHDRVMSLGNKDYEQFKKWFVDLGLRDQRIVLIRLALAFKEDLIMQLMDENQISPNFTMLNGQPFLSIAVENNSFKFIQFLVDKQANLNASGLNELKPIHYAASRGNREILEFFLQKGIENECNKDPGQLTLASIVNADLVPLLKQYNCDLNETDNQEMSALGSAIETKDYRKVEALLKSGANFNTGSPPPIFLAISSGDVFPISLLLDAGVKGFEQEELGSVPFLECIHRGTPLQVKAFLEKKHLGLSFLNDEFTITFMMGKYACRMVTAMDVAIIRKNGQIICDLIGAGIDKCAERYVTNDMIELAQEAPDLIKKILSGGSGSLLEVNLFCAMISVDCKLAQEFFIEGLVNSEKLSNAKKIILKTICKKGTTTLLSLVKNKWNFDWSYNYLTYAFENPKMFQYLLDCGVKYPSENFLDALSKIPNDLLALYLQKYPDLSELNHKGCLKAAIMNKDDDVFIQLVTAGMDSNEAGKFFTSLVWKCRYALAKYCLDLGLKFSEWECNEIFTELLFSKGSVEFLLHQNLKVHKDHLQLDQKIRGFANIIKYSGCRERIKFALALGFDPVSKPEYDFEIVNNEFGSYVFRMGFLNFLNSIVLNEDDEIFELMNPFFEVLMEKGPEEEVIKLKAFFKKWYEIKNKSKANNLVFVPRSKKKVSKSAVVEYV